jgi:redox-sensitive bicupin YhaK (pirin superfamily)
MEFKILRSFERGLAQIDWLKSYHSFSFSSYYNPQWMGFRALRVINEDYIAPSSGFGTHPHRNMEIISYVRQGSLTHKDSMGNGETIQQGEFQYMSAGVGVEHSEFNPSPRFPTQLFQIWIEPNVKDSKPEYAKYTPSGESIPAQWNGIVGPKGSGAPLETHQNVGLYHSIFTEAAQKIIFEVPKDRNFGWLHVVEGEFQVTGLKTPLQTGDAVGFSGATRLEIQNEGKLGEILLFSLN